MLIPRGVFRRGKPEIALALPRVQLLTGNFSTAIGAGAITGSRGQALTFTRATAKVCRTSASTVVALTSGQPAVEHLGLLVEAAHTNLLLRNRDLTNAAWTLSDATAAKTATGPDGVANSASTLTATANNGYVAQAITATGSRTTSVWLRRRTGTGTIAISRDGGSNYTAVTSSVSATWARVAVTSSVVNPEIRIRLGTSGDEIDVDYVQDEAGAYAHSAIETAGASGTCNKDQPSMAIASGLPWNAGAIQLDFAPLWTTATAVQLIDTRPSNTAGVALYVAGTALGLVTSNAALQQTDTASGALSWTIGQTYRIRAEWGSGNVRIYRDGTLVASVTNGTARMPDATTNAVWIGETFSETAQADGNIANLRFYK